MRIGVGGGHMKIERTNGGIFFELEEDDWNRDAYGFKAALRREIPKGALTMSVGAPNWVAAEMEARFFEIVGRFFPDRRQGELF